MPHSLVDFVSTQHGIGCFLGVITSIMQRSNQFLPLVVTQLTTRADSSYLSSDEKAVARHDYEELTEDGIHLDLKSAVNVVVNSSEFHIYIYIFLAQVPTPLSLPPLNVNNRSQLCFRDLLGEEFAILPASRC